MNVNGYKCKKKKKNILVGEKTRKNAKKFRNYRFEIPGNLSEIDQKRNKN